MNDVNYQFTDVELHTIERALALFLNAADYTSHEERAASSVMDRVRLR